MQRQKSIYCNCKPSKSAYVNGFIVCSKCWKPIKVRIRKLWAFNPKTRIQLNEKKYNRKKSKRKLRKKLKEGE